MPNWCESTVSLRGAPHLLDVIAQTLAAEAEEGEGDGLLGMFLPIPEALVGTRSPDSPPFRDAMLAGLAGAELDAAREKNEAWEIARTGAIEATGFSNWYDWALETWGTKWTDQVSYVERRPRSLRIEMATAWSTPLEGIVRICVRHGLTATVSWYESGIGLKGHYTAGPEGLRTSTYASYRGWRGG